MTEMKVHFTLLDGRTDGEVTGSTAALLHTGESFYWRLSSKISPVHLLEIYSQHVFLFVYGLLI